MSEEEIKQTTVEKMPDPTKVSKPPKEDPTRITKKERTEKQKAWHAQFGKLNKKRPLAESAAERKEERLEEIKKK